MTALSDNRQTDRKEGTLLSVPVGVDIIYRGGMVTRDTAGYAVAGQDVAGYRFEGVAWEQVDNSAGAQGDKNVRVVRDGVHLFAASGMTLTDVGKRVYLADDQTVQLTPTNVFAGKIAAFESATAVWVDIAAGVLAGNGEKLTVSGALSTFVGNRFGHIFTCPAGRKAFVLAAKLIALVKPVYATDELFNLYKYDLSGASEVLILSAADFDLDTLTAKQSVDLTLTATAASLQLDPGDALYFAVNCTGAETTAGDLGVTAEIALN